MIRPNRLGIILIVAGCLLAAFSLSVDLLGIGVTDRRFGELQFAGLSIGAIVFILGYAMVLATWHRD